MAQLLDKLDEGHMLLRVLEYGPAKSKKTWWAANAATAGFNVILLDGDDGWHILTNLPKEAQVRVQVVDLTDKTKEPVFAMALTMLLKEGKLIWDEKNKVSAKMNPKNATVILDTSTLTQNDVLVIDSWTALVWSLVLRYAKENAVDLTDPEKADRDFYGWGNAMTKWMLNQLKSLPCHVIVIGHSTVYEKYSKDGKKLEMQRRQPVSTSGPNAMQMASKFSDILYFSVKGSAFKIDVDGDNDKDGGSRALPPKVYNWDELQFADLCKAYGIPLPQDAPIRNDAPKQTEQAQPKSTGGTIPHTENKTTGIKLGIKK